MKPAALAALLDRYARSLDSAPGPLSTAAMMLADLGRPADEIRARVDLLVESGAPAGAADRDDGSSLTANVTPANWPLFLGSQHAERGLLQVFQELAARRGWQLAVSDLLPMLLPGAATDGFAHFIRTALAVRTSQPHEAMRGCAAWAANLVGVRLLPADGPPVSVDAAFSALDALDTARIAAAGEYERCVGLANADASLARLAGACDADDATLAALERACLDADHLRAADGAEVTVAACRAMATLLPFATSPRVAVIELWRNLLLYRHVMALMASARAVPAGRALEGQRDPPPCIDRALLRAWLAGPG